MSNSNNDPDNGNSPVKNNSPEKIMCVAAYIFGLPGALFVRLAGKKSGFCLHHARRSLELFLFMVFLIIAWYVITYILILFPYIGFPVAMAVFGIVVAAFIFCLILSIMGMVKALRRETVVFPLVSSVAGRIEPFFKFIGLAQE